MMKSLVAIIMWYVLTSIALKLMGVTYSNLQWVILVNVGFVGCIIYQRFDK
jgi:hypothetical protein